MANSRLTKKNTLGEKQPIYCYFSVSALLSLLVPQNHYDGKSRRALMPLEVTLRVNGLLMAETPHGFQSALCLAHW